MKKLLVFCVIFACSTSLYADPARDGARLYYFLEVGNQIALSDFQMGSIETIKDKDGNGLGWSFLLREGHTINLALDMGYSKTIYKGAIEDGVDVAFTPQSGTGYEILSSSTNVTYDFDVAFQNPYLGLNVLFDHFLIGGGRLFQTAQGGVRLSSQKIAIATASYKTGTQMYWIFGFHGALGNLYFGAYARGFEAPALNIDSCNIAALGELACARLQSATNNRNLRSNQFGEGILKLGLLF